jgi:hypothetical protein
MEIIRNYLKEGENWICVVCEQLLPFAKGLIQAFSGLEKQSIPVCASLAKRNTTKMISMIDLEAVKEGKVPSWSGYMTSFKNGDKNTGGMTPEAWESKGESWENIKPYVKTIKKECVTLNMLASTVGVHTISRIDMLDIDCGGNEREIIESLPDLEIRPNLIHVNAQYMDSRDISDSVRFLENLGYDTTGKDGTFLARWRGN